MKRWLKRLTLLVSILFIGVVLFFLWARSGTRSEDELATHMTYSQAVSGNAVPDTITVMTYNIGYLSGMTNNEALERSEQLFSQNLEAAADLIRQADPDLVAFQEIDFGATRSYDVHQLDTLAALLDYPEAALAVNWDKRYLPWPGLRPSLHFGRVLSGQAVLSRFPIKAHRRIVLQRPPHDFYYDAFYLDRLAQVVRLDVGRPLVLINVHLEAFHEATREAQARRVRALYEQYQRDTPVLLVGDFNSIMPAARRSRRLPAEVQAQFATDRTLDTLLAAGQIKEAFPPSVYAMGQPETFTFPADNPRVKIDHIFYDATRIQQVGARVLSHPDHPSDHRAVVMEFVFQ